MGQFKLVLAAFLLLFSSNGFSKELSKNKFLLNAEFAKEDTNRVNLLVQKVDSLFPVKPDEAFKLAAEVVKLAQKLNYAKGEGNVFKCLGRGYFTKGEYVKAAISFDKGLDKFESIHYLPGIKTMLKNLALVLHMLKSDSLVIQLYLKTLKYAEESNDSIEYVTACRILGGVYSLKESTRDKAIEYYFKAFSKCEAMGDTDGLGEIAVYLGNVYYSKEDYIAALSYFERALKACKTSKTGKVPYPINIAQIYEKKKDYRKALAYLQEALQKALIDNSKYEISDVHLELANIYHTTGETQKALKHYRLSEKFAGNTLQLKSVLEGMINFYSEMDDVRMAFKYQTKLSSLNDSLLASAEKRNLNQSQTINSFTTQKQIESMQKEAEIQKRDADLKEARNKQLRTVIFFLVLGVLSILIFMVLLVRANNHKKKVNAELVHKNNLITAQKQEITASIQYASRIQNALLLPEAHIANLLPENFILFRPRDIVSGDFYWLADKIDRVICIVADCTGHGVPGAFMSMLGIAFLNEIINKNPQSHAHEILNDMRSQVEVSLRQTGRSEDIRDGMDVALLIFDLKRECLEFAGANNPLIIIRNQELIEYKPDKMPIGYHNIINPSFTNHQIDIHKRDMLYLFSDGYRDQMGGPNGKRFMMKNFRKLLLEVNEMEVKLQKQILEQRLDEWIYETEQIDDILVMGIRI